MVRFPVYVEWGVSRFGVSHILPIGQVEGDIEEVYGFLVGLHKIKETVLNLVSLLVLISSTKSKRRC